MHTGAPRVAVIGGSGLYQLLDPARSVTLGIPTPYGPARVSIGGFAGRPVVFLARHGAGHAVPPHLIGYRANAWALASLGVRVVVSSSAVGGLHPDFPPGTLALPDQLVDRTHGRADTFFTGRDEDGGSVQHLSAADPFDPELHAVAVDALAAAGEIVAPAATVVVINGPRFSTRAESSWYRAQGAHLINMTMAPEVTLAAELGLRTVNLSFVTDADAGSGDAADRDDMASAALVFRRLADAQPRIVSAIETVVRALPAEPEPGTGIPADAIAEVLARTTRAARP